MKHTSQKNFFKIPSNILAKIENIQSDKYIVGCVKELAIQDIKDGIYEHLGIVWDKSSVNYNHQIMPNIKVGRYSKYNSYGRVIKLKKLPKIEKNYSDSRPNFGDSSKGYHDVSWTRKVWQRKILLPKEALINITLIEQKDNSYIFKFMLDTPLFKADTSFMENLLFYCNLIQENIGICDIYNYDITNEELVNTLYVSWELIPVGVSDDDILNILTKKFKNSSPKTIEILTERIAFFKSLEIKSRIIGTNNFNRYFGAILKNDFAIFENIKYGNAIYIFKKNWQELSKMNRIELQKIKSDDIIRIPHSSKWKSNLLKNIEEVF